MSMKSCFAAAHLTAAAFLLTACVSSEKLAVRQNYVSCDGFGNVLDSGDGVTALPSNMMVNAGTLSRDDLALGQSGIDACDRAIAQLDAEFPEQWIRKVSLLQARAVHHLQTRDAEAALADLAAADAAAVDPDDMFYARSIGANTELLRIMTKVRLRKHDGVEAEALKLFAQRPYARTSGVGTLIALGPEASEETILPILAQTSSVFPQLAVSYYDYLFEIGDYEDVLRLAAEMTPPRAQVAEGYDLVSDKRAEAQIQKKDSLFWIDTHVRAAYAAAALGDKVQADTYLREAETVSKKGRPKLRSLPPEPRKQDREIRKYQEQMRREFDSEAAKILEGWTSLVAARLASNDGMPDAAAKILSSIQSPPPTTAFMRFAAELGDHQAASFLNSPAGRTAVWTVSNMPSADLFLMWKVLFEGESQARVGSKVPLLDAMFTGSDDLSRGKCREDKNSDGTETICFHGHKGTLAMSEEQALLRAAAITLKRGQQGFRIEKRKDTQITLVSTYYGVPTAENEMGVESRLIIRFYDETPDDCMRCIRAWDVYNALAPVYGEEPEIEALKPAP